MLTVWIPLFVQVSLKPIHVLQCHSKLDSCDDFSTQLWSCSFQPQEHSTGTDPSWCRFVLFPQCQMKWTKCVFRWSGGDVWRRHSLPDRLWFWDGDEEIQSYWRGLFRFTCLIQFSFQEYHIFFSVTPSDHVRCRLSCKWPEKAKLRTHLCFKCQFFTIRMKYLWIGGSVWSVGPDVMFGAAGVLLSGLVYSADVQRRSVLRSALQYPGCRREKGLGQTDPPTGKRCVREVQSEPQVPVGPPLSRSTRKLPVQ